MTMFTLPNFCRVCLKYDKNLIDLEHIENEPNETLVSKLHQCVSEVEWSVFKPLLCHPCIKRLNIAYNFKKQCIQSASVLKSYVALVKENQLKEDADAAVNGGGDPLMVAPNQNLIKIVMGPQNDQTFQNLFFNVVPTTTITPVIPVECANPKDSNQNVFLNLNNTFQKYIPSSLPQFTENNGNAGQFLTEGNMEEVSCEIDPTDLGLDDNSSENEDCNNDGWAEFHNYTIKEKKINGASHNNGKSDKAFYGNFVPILPKQPSVNEDQVNFFNSGQHFLSSTHNFQGTMNCDRCQKSFLSMKALRGHINETHEGNYPFRCECCQNEFILKSDYEQCLKSHQNFDSTVKLKSDPGELKNDPLMEESNCELCNRTFNSQSGLLRHKVRKHNQKNRKKYFIKGMKNARCDICKREFSTQSYMQLHRKLHLRDDIGYKYKVFGKHRYTKKAEESKCLEKRIKVDVKTETLSDSDDNQSALFQPEVVMDSS